MEPGKATLFDRVFSLLTVRFERIVAFNVQRNVTRAVISVVTKENIGTDMVVHLVYTPTSRIDGMHMS